MIQGIDLGDILLDCPDAEALCDFYAQLLGWEKCLLYGLPGVRGRGLIFLFAQEEDYIRPVWPEAAAQQQKQMHRDFVVDDLPEAVCQAEALGAVLAGSQFGGDAFVTLLDPAGHPFCLCAKE